MVCVFQDPYERAMWLDTRDEDDADTLKTLVWLTLSEVEHFTSAPAWQLAVE